MAIVRDLIESDGLEIRMIMPRFSGARLHISMTVRIRRRAGV
ncbi:hypothetical protein Thpro_020588 [Acidihalobacter prosperus]|uniref:Uncharacterized protein n=1 Tax=Acidihalobacter prosperus TaxID=160660 RepID=A0A1A6C8H7_9GAMM|nr:hypothetical protein Thpro_020588 [Acidihalobacter prosperus]